MRLVKVALASVNTTVGAVESNVGRALTLAQKMAAEDVTVGVFQEQLVGGYPAEDLVLWQGFVDAQWEALQRFARETATLRTVFVLGVTVAVHGRRYNCAAVIAGGRVLGLVPKEKLPTYGVFYEGRTFDLGQPGLHAELHGVPLGDLLFRFEFGTLGTEVCEDAWSPEGPAKRRAYGGAELICNVSASPFRLGIVQTRRELLATRAQDLQATVAYANALGANDGLIFDGGGFLAQNGKWLLDAPRWTEGYATAVVDLDRTSRMRAENSTWRQDHAQWIAAHPPPRLLDCTEVVRPRREKLAYPVPRQRSFFLPDDRPHPTARQTLCEDILDALSQGVGDYFEKTRAFTCIGIALSGGRDSLLTLLIAHRYAKRVRPENPGSLIQAFYMPSRYSSQKTHEAAEAICLDLGVPFTVVPITDAVEREREAALSMLPQGEKLTELTEQNIQARIRAQRMWNWSNTSGGLFLQTGNMSERAVGYTTTGGDLMGALAVIANVPKTVVMYLLDYLLETTGYEGIRKVLAHPAGPELAAEQWGEDELMPFPVLDACFHLFADEKLLPTEVKQVVAQMFPEVPAERIAQHVEKFARLFTQSIYKWVQAPLSLHIGNLDLDRERALQLPVVTSREWWKR
jgi:NAD+ synthase (glutamine-hydrolysing)